MKPSEEIIAKASKAFDVVLSDGRTFKIKKPSIIKQLQFVEALGETAENRVYMAAITPLMWVTGIDDEVLAPVTTKLQLEALLKRIGDDAYEELQLKMAEKLDEVPEESEESLKK